MIYQELTLYSPTADAEITRISTSDDRGFEYFSLVRRPQRSGMWKAVREAVLDTIEAVLEKPPHEREPGEVPVADQQYQG